jgi:hypothetical protein
MTHPPKSDLDLNSISRYVSSRIGVPAGQARRMLFAFAEYIILNLIDMKVIKIPYLGTFYIDASKRVKTSIKNSTRHGLKFKAAVDLKKWFIGTNYTKEEAEKLREVGINLVPPLSVACVEDTQKMLEIKSILEREQELDGLSEEIYKEEDLIFLSLLVYLQQEFPYATRGWKNPVTKQEYTYLEIKRVVEKYAKFCPEQFRKFLLLWVGCARRKQQGQYFGYTGEELRREWKRTVDTMLLMLYFNDSNPTVAHELYNLLYKKKVLEVIVTEQPQHKYKS